MQKKNSRSFRYTDEVKEILENFNGNNLNEKFDNLVLYCFRQVPLTEKRLKDLEKEISRKRKVLSDLSHETQRIEMLIKDLESVQQTVNAVSVRAKNIADKMQ